MKARLLQRITRLLAERTELKEPWLDETAEAIQGTVTALFDQAGEQGIRIKDVLHGTWLGHALHPALIVAPAGAWTTAAVLDMVGDEAGARTAVGFGVLAAVPTAASGLVDWIYTSGRSRRLGLVHASVNGVALACYTLSWMCRKTGHRPLGITLSTTGFGLMAAAAYLGGEISYTLGQGVNRNAWSPEVEDSSDELNDFREVARYDDLREGQIQAGELDVEGTKIPLVLMRRGKEVLALNGICSHLGAPLAEGKLVDEWCVECPWHGSRFDFRDGEVARGPAAYSLPRFETRVRDGAVEARVARAPADTLDKMLTST